jgi:hypothetical protein
MARQCPTAHWHVASAVAFPVVWFTVEADAHEACGRQRTAPESAANVPPAHASQVVAPRSAWNEPAAHGSCAVPVA